MSEVLQPIQLTKPLFVFRRMMLEMLDGDHGEADTLTIGNPHTAQGEDAARRCLSISFAGSEGGEATSAFGYRNLLAPNGEVQSDALEFNLVSHTPSCRTNLGSSLRVAHRLEIADRRSRSDRNCVTGRLLKREFYIGSDADTGSVSVIMLGLNVLEHVDFGQFSEDEDGNTLLAKRSRIFPTEVGQVNVFLRRNNILEEIRGSLVTRRLLRRGVIPSPLHPAMKKR
jgi:hypothetical protein